MKNTKGSKGPVKSSEVAKLGGKASNAGTKYMSSSDYSCQNKGSKLAGK